MFRFGRTFCKTSTATRERAEDSRHGERNGGVVSTPAEAMSTNVHQERIYTGKGRTKEEECSRDAVDIGMQDVPRG